MIVQNLKYKVSFISLFLIFSFSITAISQEKKVRYITYPLMTAPLIVERNKLLDVEIDFSSLDEVESLNFTLSKSSNKEISFPLKVKKVSFNNNKKTKNYKLKLPKNIEDGLYNLEVEIKSQNNILKDVQYKSVKVIPKFKDSFSFVVTCDLHVSKVSSLFSPENYDTVQVAFEKIEKRKPEFVLIAGDIINGSNYKREYEDVYEFFKSLQVPIYVVPGNHDSLVLAVREKKTFIEQDGIEFWKNYFGKRNFSFVYGKFYFIGIDTFHFSKEERRSQLLSWGAISDEHLAWIEKEMKKAKKLKKEIIIFGHHPVHSDNSAEPDMSNTGKEKFLELCKKYKVKMVFSGHTHWDSLDIIDGIYFVGVTTLSALPYQNGYLGFREIEIKNNEIVKINYKDPQFEEYNKLVGPWIQTPWTEKKWSIPLEDVP